MSIKVAGMWELGWNTPIKEVDLWRFPLRDFGVEEWMMCPVSGIASSKVKEYKNMVDVFDANPDHMIVFVDEKAETDLREFEHPEKALYVFGRASYSPYVALKDHIDREYLTVRIPTVANDGLLWPHQAASILLYDRAIK